MNYRTTLLSLSIASSLLLACSADNDQLPPTRVSDRAILEIEQFTGTEPSLFLQWLPVQLDGDFGAAVRLVAKDQAAWSNTGLPTLQYEIDFTRTGTYALSVRARRDSAFNNGSTTQFTFGSDTGNVTTEMNGFDDQWQWHNTDINGEAVLLTVQTPGVHYFSVASDATGLLLDQIEINRISDTTAVAQNIDNNTNASADNTTSPAITDTATDTADTAPVTVDDTNTHNTLTDTELQTNTAPDVSISAATTVEAGQPLTLQANATDDGQPHGNIYYYWSKTAGADTATFSSRQQASTTVTFSQAGRYTLQANANDGELNRNAYINIDVTAPTVQAPQQEQEQEQQPTTGKFNPAGNWNRLNTSGAITARHEAGGVVVNGKLYVMGGRGKRPVEVFDPSNNTWRKVADAPLEMHHFQPVAIGEKIYVIGAFTCCYPIEKVIDTVYIFDTRTNKWSKGPKLPATRKRGSAGAAVYNGKIYLLGGNTRGHSGGAVNWFDEFDPNTGNWRALANAPDARDHVTIGVANGKLVAAGGRKTNHPVTFANTVSRTNVYDMATDRWSNAANIPTQRAGTMTVSQSSEVIIIGGESSATDNAHKNVEAFDVQTGSWRTLKPMLVGRHGGAAAIIDGALHVVSGSEKRAAGRETRSHEVLR